MTTRGVNSVLPVAGWRVAASGYLPSEAKESGCEPCHLTQIFMCVTVAGRERWWCCGAFVSGVFFHKKHSGKCARSGKRTKTVFSAAAKQENLLLASDVFC